MDVGLIITPIGYYRVETCDKGLHSVQLDSSADLTNDCEINFLRFPENDSSYLFQVIEWFRIFFSNRPLGINEMTDRLQICPDLKTTEFRRHLWSILKSNVKWGETVSYRRLAEMSGYKKTACRAVGSAMAQNPISLIIPCHRVIKSDGTYGNYSSLGSRNDVKVWLIERELRLS